MAIARKRFQLAGALLLVSCFGGLPPAAAGAATSTTPASTDSITLRSSADRGELRASVVFTAKVTTQRGGGTFSFYANNQPIPGCTALPATAPSSATCSTSFDIPGDWTITADYSYPTVSGGAPGSAPLTTSLTQRVVRGIRVVKTPPEVRVGTVGPKDEPDFNLTLLAIRSTRMPHRFWFAVEGVRCVNRASYVLVTIARRTLTDRCGARIERATTSLAVHRYYRLTLRSIRYRNGRVVARGPACQVRLYMPGDEVHWPAISGVKQPLSNLPPASPAT